MILTNQIQPLKLGHCHPKQTKVTRRAKQNHGMCGERRDGRELTKIVTMSKIQTSMRRPCHSLVSNAVNSWPSELNIELKTYLGIPGMPHLGGDIEPGPEAATAALKSVVTMLYVSVLL